MRYIGPMKVSIRLAYVGARAQAQAQPISVKRAVACAALVSCLLVGVWTVSGDSPGDFGEFYSLAWAVGHGQNPYDSAHALAIDFMGQTYAHPTPLPPTLGLLLLPLTLTTGSMPMLLWLLLGAACLVLSVYLLAALFGVKPALPLVLALACALLLWYPVSEEFRTRQLDLMQLALVLSMWRLSQKGHSVGAGVAGALAVLVRQSMGLVLLWFVFKRDWKALGASIATIAVGYVVSMALVGLNAFSTYLTSVVPGVTAVYRGSNYNQSLYSTAWRIFDGTTSPNPWHRNFVAPPLIDAPSVAPVLSLAISAIALAVLLWLAVMWRANDEWVLVLLVGGTLLLSPISWQQAGILLLIPLVAIARTIRSQQMAGALPKWAIPSAACAVALAAVPLPLWADAARALSGWPPEVGYSVTLSAWPALLTLGPALSVVGVLALFIVLTLTHRRTMRRRAASRRSGVVSV